MKVLARRDRLGARRIVFDPGSGAYAGDLSELLARVPAARTAGLDAAGVDAAWGLADAPDRTCLRAVRCVPPGMSLVLERGRTTLAPSPSPSPSRSSLATALVDAAARALRSARRSVVALGGGLDAALSVLAARRAGIAVERAVVLAIPGTTYDETTEARATATALGLELHEIAITTEELARELPRAVRLGESPLYNMHPVSRAIVARVAEQRGHDALLTGDGADQAARGATERADYVPIVAAITRGSGLALASPFLDDAVVDLLAASADPGKRALRELAVAWGLPASVAERAKVPCVAPPLPHAAFPCAGALTRLSGALGRALAWSEGDDRANVGVASLAAFVSGFEHEHEHDAHGGR